MYIFHLIINILKPRNIPSLLYFLANMTLCFLLMYFLNLISFGQHIMPEKSQLYNGLVGIAIYLGGAIIFLSPIGEAFFRLTYELKSIEKYPNLAQVQAIFNEVYAKAKAEYPGIPSGVKLYIKNTGIQNAAAVGRKTIFLTQGILSLPPDQLKGILAHELAHLYHGDTVILLLILVGNIYINALAMVIKFALSILGIFILLGGGRDSSASERIGGYLMARLARFLVDVVVGIWTLIGLALKNISSRAAEFKADEFACELGYGRHLASALAFISRGQEGRKGTLLDRALASHPDTSERIRRCGGVA